MEANTTRIEGLDPNTDYIVQVSATNSTGTSALSLIVIAPKKRKFTNFIGTIYLILK